MIIKNKILHWSLFFIICSFINISCNKNETIDENKDPNYTAPTSESSNTQDSVYEYTPAPGQFIGETSTGGFSGNEKTAKDAVSYATERLAKKKFVSLGGFGGYIVVGFDHSIEATTNTYDFAIRGNAYEGSSEPGIVWVMQDSNGNGKPDDTWYELKGSENDSTSTFKNYSVTYTRPSKAGQSVSWTDSKGKSGQIDYLSEYHTQDYYYPTWITADSYTLTSTCLKARNTEDDSGQWTNATYKWGYVDNYGSDNITISGEDGQWNGFSISNAIKTDGTAAHLKFIDFIKVQTGVNAKSGWIGEISTEVYSFIDLSID